MSDDPIVSEYLQAMEAERQAWKVLGKRFPGHPGFSPLQWSAWLEAVARAKKEADRCLPVPAVIPASKVYAPGSPRHQYALAKRSPKPPSAGPVSQY